MHSSTRTRTLRPATRLACFAALGAFVLGFAWGCGDRSDENGLRWWRGNTHTHTLWSDGDGAPELVSSFYRERGYHFLVLSDHNILSEGEKWFPVSEDSRGRLTAARLAALQESFGDSWVELREHEGGQQMRLKTLAQLRERFEAPGEFLFIQGEEITDDFEGAPVHVNGVHLDELIPPQGGDSLQDVMQRNVDAVVEQGRRLDRPTLAHINHPNFGWALTPEIVASIRGERFFEVYNGHPGVRNHGDDTHASTEEMWDQALAWRLTHTELGLLYGLATDDSHHYHSWGQKHVNPGRGWVMVRAAELEAGAIVTAMEAGEFYASSGVGLEALHADENELSFAIEAESDVNYHTEFIGTRRTADGHGPVGVVLARSDSLRPRYRFEGDELYVRARITSDRLHPNPYAIGDREMAWVQPVRPGTP